MSTENKKPREYTIYQMGDECSGRLMVQEAPPFKRYPIGTEKIHVREVLPESENKRDESSAVAKAFWEEFDKMCADKNAEISKLKEALNVAKRYFKNMCEDYWDLRPEEKLNILPPSHMARQALTHIDSILKGEEK